MLTARDRRLFAQAALVAVGAEGRVRVGALLAKGRTTLALGTNVAVPDQPMPQNHAERRVLRGHETRFNCTLYVARLGLNGSLLPSKPCDDCMAHILYGTTVRHLVYLDDNHNLVKVRT